MRRTRVAAVLAVGALVLVAAGVAAARGFSPGSGFLSDPALGAARLSGTYAVTGVVSAADGIPGEAPGQQVKRSWTLISSCPTGACALLGLRRQRAGTTDSLLLRRVAPGLYAGSGRFTAPVQCHGRNYPAGAVVPYELTVMVTSAAHAGDGSLIATGFSATYSSGAHLGLTTCFQPPTHDAAAYSGVLPGG